MYMEKRRYIFQQAYEDYFHRITALNEFFMAKTKAIWQWFWEGTGAKSIDIFLRTCLFVAGVVVGIMYIIYEKKHSSALSIKTFLACLVIMGIVLLLMWGWKAPVHFCAKSTSGLVASSSVFVLAVSLLIGALFLFSLYFLLLFILTVLSCLIFLPVRTAEEIWLLYRKVKYICPYDDCSHSGLPIHICSCGQKYSNLQPNFFGIFKHTCYHGGDKEKEILPTLNILGRNKLERLCGRCNRPLGFSSIGELAVDPIAIIGGPNSGKTIFLTQAIRHIKNYFEDFPKARVRLDAADQEETMKYNTSLLDSGHILSKTVGNAGPAFGLAVKVPKYKHLLYLYDAPGEDFVQMERFGKKQMIENISGIILLYDPSSSAYFTQPEVFNNPFNDILAATLRGVAELKNKADIPIAVVISKIDVLPEGGFPFFENLLPENILDERIDANEYDYYNSRCRTVLEKLGEGNNIRILDNNFSHVSYFACSALGRSPDSLDNSPFIPYGILNPFIYLLNLPKTTIIP
jgi:GTPase SAR1 family protein